MLNYDNVTKEGDIRHLLKGFFVKFPDISDYQAQKLSKIYQNISYSAPEGTYDLELSELKAIAWDEFFQYKCENDHDYQKAFAEYRKKLSDDFTDFEIVNDNGILTEFIGKKYSDLSKLYKELKSKFDYKDFMNIRMYILEDLQYVSKKGIRNIYDETVFIESMLKNISIDVRTCSVASFRIYLINAREEAKRIQKRNNERQKSKA